MKRYTTYKQEGHHSSKNLFALGNPAIFATILIIGGILLFTNCGNSGKVLYEKATAAYSEGDVSNAYDLYLRSAAEGYAEAQFVMGEWYEIGKVASKNINEAIRWYSKAAEQGNVRAQSRLGILCFEGKECSRDIDRAKKWLTKAADRGDKEAQFTLGRIYVENGQCDVASKYFSLSAAQNDALSYVYLGHLEEDPYKSIEYFAKASELENNDETMYPTFPHQYITRLCFLVPGHP